jgi:hypothetical protein
MQTDARAFKAKRASVIRTLMVYFANTRNPPGDRAWAKSLLAGCGKMDCAT